MNRLILPLLVAALVVPATAQASERVGVDPDSVYGATPQTCADGCTIVQDVNANLSVRVPQLAGGRGVVTSWKMRGSGGSARLRRLEGVTARGATGWAALTGATQTVAATLPVRSGDRMGVDLSSGATIAGDESFYGDTALAWTPALGETESSQPDAQFGGYVAYQAVVEPDADGDGRGDETQDSCVSCGGGSHSTPPPPPPPPPSDPYAAIRKTGPKVGLPAAGLMTRRSVAVTVTNPYAFALKGRLTLKRGRKVAGRASVKLPAGGAQTVKVKVKRALARKRTLKLTAIAVMKGPVGKARATRHKLTVKKAGKPAGGINGKYGGTGVSADWVMVVDQGVVQNFNGRMTLYCTKQKAQETVTFAMVGSNPKPHVAADGTFAWEATKDYGFQKLKFSGRVSGGTVTGKMMVEDRPLIQGVDPVSGLPRIEAEYCFAGADYTLTKQ
jgi:hypothetical protein